VGASSNITGGGISNERLNQVVKVLERAGISAETIGALRQAFAPIHFTCCQDEDLGEGNGVAAPVRSTPAFNLYLIDGQDHCLRLTDDPAAATGLLVAELDAGAS
jgi:hypothetical protein